MVHVCAYTHRTRSQRQQQLVTACSWLPTDWSLTVQEKKKKQSGLIVFSLQTSWQPFGAGCEMRYAAASLLPSSTGCWQQRHPTRSPESQPQIKWRWRNHSIFGHDTVFPSTSGADLYVCSKVHPDFIVDKCLLVLKHNIPYFCVLLRTFVCWCRHHVKCVCADKTRQCVKLKTQLIWMLKLSLPKVEFVLGCKHYARRAICFRWKFVGCAGKREPALLCGWVCMQELAALWLFTASKSTTCVSLWMPVFHPAHVSCVLTTHLLCSSQ